MNGKLWRRLLGGTVVPLCLAAEVSLAAGPFPFTTEWYRQRADDPPGARQVEKHGKLWPPQPRPVGRKQTLVHGYHTAHYWPYPYSCEDEAYVRNIFEQQAGAGWIDATTLHDYHFQAESNRLTDAGELHIQYVAARVPSQHRTLYVSQGGSAEIGQVRAGMVQDYLQRVGLEGSLPVVARQDFYVGRPANEVDRLRTLELNSIRSPRLFTVGNSRGGSSSSGGGGQATSGTGGGGSSGGSSGSDSR
jgi:uncharacterized membrane protein YgcG